MRRIGYARVSTGDQNTAAQIRALKAAGCTEIHEEHASGGDRARPVLWRIMAGIGGGDTLVVVRIDRLARSLAHLLDILAALEAKGAHFRSLRDPIDTASPQGKFTLQVLGAAAEFERALIRERTKAGLQAAKAKGRIGGNPGLRAGDPGARAKVARARDEAFFARLTETAEDWVPLVRRHRPDMPWGDLARLINARLPRDRAGWSEARLKRAARRYVKDGLLPAAVMDRARPAPPDDRLVALVAGIKGADPGLGHQQICDRLMTMREPTPRGQRIWQPSSVHMLIGRARRLGLLPPE